jgi:cbb3-type cytochrome oxidase maturation protein
MSFLTIWIGYAIVGVTIFSLVFVWAVRARQFTDFDRARYIALNAVKQVESDQYDQSISKIDRCTWIMLSLVALAGFSAAIYLGVFRGGH